MTSGMALQTWPEINVWYYFYRMNEWMEYMNKYDDVLFCVDSMKSSPPDDSSDSLQLEGTVKYQPHTPHTPYIYCCLCSSYFNMFL